MPAVPTRVEKPPVAAGPIADIRLDYEFAERVGTRTAWEAFLAAHPAGFYSSLARAQLAKLGTGEAAHHPAAAKPDVQDAAGEERRPPVGRESDRLKEERDVKAQRERLRLEHEAAVKADTATRGAPASAEDACKRDEERLVRLRTSRAREEVMRFERELACERLRPQVVRLLESVGSD